MLRGITLVIKFFTTPKEFYKCVYVEAAAIDGMKMQLLKEVFITTNYHGPENSFFLIVVTDGFSEFDIASQLCSYIGITPTTRESGSSVIGRARISKVDNEKLLNMLFLCSFNACKHNKACREELYEHIINEGKSRS